MITRIKYWVRHLLMGAAIAAPTLLGVSCQATALRENGPPVTLDEAQVVELNGQISTCDALNLGDAISLQGNSICFSGTLDEGDDQALRSILEGVNGVNALVIRSDGGVAYHSIRVAEIVFEFGLDVIVWDYCTSGCSNYVFVAGANKYLVEGALLGFHGGPLQNVAELYVGLRGHSNLAHLSDRDVRSRAEALWADEDFEYHRQERFFAALGLRSDLIYDISRLDLAGKLVALNIDERMQNAPAPGPETISIGWFPSPQRLYTEYSIPNIRCERCTFDDEYTIEHSINRGFLLFESLEVSGD